MQYCVYAAAAAASRQYIYCEDTETKHGWHVNSFKLLFSLTFCTGAHKTNSDCNVSKY